MIKRGIKHKSETANAKRKKRKYIEYGKFVETLKKAAELGKVLKEGPEAANKY